MSNLLFDPVFYRTYSRTRANGAKESFSQVGNRAFSGLADVGRLTDSQTARLRSLYDRKILFPSGRWLWCGGTSWLEKASNRYGAYNCSSISVQSVADIAQLMNLAMCGTGTGAVLEPANLARLPRMLSTIEVTKIIGIGNRTGGHKTTKLLRASATSVKAPPKYVLTVGDSREGWVDAVREFINLSANATTSTVKVEIDLSNVRPFGVKLRGFGGVSNPIKLPGLFPKLANIINTCVAERNGVLSALEVCLLLDECALVVVAGSIRRSAGMRQGSPYDPSFVTAKQGLWQLVENSWQIDPKRDALRMANHTQVFHTKPTIDQCLKSVESQYRSGEGAIMFAPEAIARANADILRSPEDRRLFIEDYTAVAGRYAKDKFYFLQAVLSETVFKLIPDNPDLALAVKDIKAEEWEDRSARYGLNPCAEIIGNNFLCNLSEVHLINLDPDDLDSQAEAFHHGGLICATLLHHRFDYSKLHKSRKIDPIVGVSFTGLFDFFVKAFGVDWLRWWEAGRVRGYPKANFYLEREREYLSAWRNAAVEGVKNYCLGHGLKVPNRCTTVQPGGTKSLLTGSSPGWHPPKAAYFIRRITFNRDNPVALACIELGYNVVPGQSDTDKSGKLLNDPYDPRCTEWLIEIPCATVWASLEGAESIRIDKFSALAQLDFYLQVQNYYSEHNTSGTIELTEAEIEPLAGAIHKAIQEDRGYISVALLARFDSLETFPRLPFEPITRAKYKELVSEIGSRARATDFDSAYYKFLGMADLSPQSPAGCDSDKCLIGDLKR
jgi:ribonucleotide reductase, class II